MHKIAVLFVSILMLSSAIDPFEFNFGKDKSGEDGWVINDGVMGGLSKGRAEMKDNSLFFSGTISLENNGGFTSFRAPYKRMNLSGYITMEVKYKSTGRTCAISLDQSTRFWLQNHKLNLPLSDEWNTISIPLTELNEFRMGRKTGRTMSLEKAASIIRIGIITDSKDPGEFTFEIDYIKFS